MTTELVSARTDIQAETEEEMTERGTVIEARGLAEGIEMIEACLEGMLDATTMTAPQEEIAIYSKDGWIEEVVDEGLHEAIEMNSPNKWAVEIERRAQVHHRRRRNLLPISQTLSPSQKGKGD